MNEQNTDLQDDSVAADTEPAQPYTKTSAFFLMVGTVVGGPIILLIIGIMLPHMPVDAAQQSDLFQQAFNTWLQSMAISTGGNVAIRGAVSIVKHYAQSKGAADVIVTAAKEKLVEKVAAKSAALQKNTNADDTDDDIFKSNSMIDEDGSDEKTPF